MKIPSDPSSHYRLTSASLFSSFHFNRSHTGFTTQSNILHDQLCRNTMNNGTSLPSPWSTAVPAVLLDDVQRPLQKHEAYDMTTEFLLCFDNFRPRFEVRVRLSDTDDTAGISDMNACHLEQGLNKVLVVTLMKSQRMVVRTLAATPEAYRSYDPVEKGKIDDLPADTRSAIDSIKVQANNCVPILLELDYYENSALTTNLTLKRPAWAKILGQQGLTDGRLTLLLHGDELTKEKIQALANILRDGNDPLSRFHMPSSAGGKAGTSSQRYNRQEFMAKTIANRHAQPNIGYQVTINFRDLQEYSTVFFAGAILDRMGQLQKIKKYQAELDTLVLVECSKNGHRTGFYGFINVPKDESFRLRAGDCLDVHFQKAKSSLWQAVVTAPLEIQREDMIPFWVSRTKAIDPKADGYQEDTFEPAYIDPHGMSIDDLEDAVARDKGNAVAVEVVGIGDSLDNICKAYESLDQFSKTQASERSAFGQRIVEILTSRRLDQLPVQDLYQHIHGHMVDENITAFMQELNPRQHEAIEISRNLKAGIQIIQGPPGTGKTFIMHQMIVPFFTAMIQTIVLVSTVTNHGADGLAQEIREALYALKDKPELSHIKKRYVLRLHAEATELSIMQTQGPKQSVVTANKYKDGLSLEKTKQGPSGAATQLLDDSQALDGCKFEGVRDKRVQDITYSAGHMMLLKSGVIPDSGFEDQDGKHDPWETFRRLYCKRYVRGEPFVADDSVNEEAELEIASAALYKAVLNGASVIISTTAGIAGSHCIPHVTEKVAAVFLDENAHEREDSLAPLFAARLRLNPCIVVIGDQQQLPPGTQADVTRNAFAPQLQMSWMARLIQNGMQYTMLAEQHRMVEDIALVCNTLAYGGRLINAPSTELARRPKAIRFREWMLSLFATSQLASNRFLVDIRRGGLNVTRDKKGSKYNDYFVCYTATLLESLLKASPDASIAIFTPYSEQRGNYLRMLRNMRSRNVSHTDNVTVDTLDGAQGRQFDFVLVDFVVNETIGFLQDYRRLNVAVTRARDGLIVVCDKTTILQARNNTYHMTLLLKLFQTCTLRHESVSTYPTTPFFKPYRDGAGSRKKGGRK